MLYRFRKTLYNCKQATLLSIKKSEGKISMIESVKLRYHLMFCDPCRRFIAQWEQLENNNEVTNSHRSVEAPAFKLSDESRKRISEKIQGLL